ncbi:hypothetical protein I548_4675 [Mycobacterium intracellulare]|nr:hypothetical protein I548_4675 [Mycobacterium intracellulare]
MLTAPLTALRASGRSMVMSATLPAARRRRLGGSPLSGFQP